MQSVNLNSCMDTLHLSLDIIRNVIPRYLGVLDIIALSRSSKYLHRLLKNNSLIRKWQDFTSTHSKNTCMYEAAQGGDLQLVMFFVDKGATDYDLGMCYAAFGGKRGKTQRVSIV